MSNVLEVVLPLDTHEIRLPPRDSRSGEEELYLEYLEVNEGSGYLPAMDSKLNWFPICHIEHKFWDRLIWANNADPYQNAPRGAI